MSQCNHCSMKAIERDARKQGKRVVKMPSALMGSMGGFEIHVTGPWEKPSKKNFKAWMMEITQHCVC